MPKHSYSGKRRGSFTSTGRYHSAKKRVGKRAEVPADVVKRVVNSLAETKYFNVAKYIGEEPLLAAWRDGNTASEIAVLGFTTGYEKAKLNPSTDQAYKYGVNDAGNNINMNGLDLNSIYHGNETNPAEAAQAVTGNTVRPSYAETNWLLTRSAGETDDIGDVSNGLIYRVRMIRCKPRAKKGSYQDVNPREDLFLDQTNTEFGISSNLYGSTVKKFNAFEFNLAKPNTRKYVILEDTTFTMGPASTYHALATTTDPYDVKQGMTSSVKTFKRRHDIGSEFYYTDPSNSSDIAESYPADGFTGPEFVLFHVWACGNQESIAIRKTPDLLRISCRPISTFKDI